MNFLFTNFGEAAQTGGIAALGLDVKRFLFSLITFLLVLAFLRKYAYKQIIGTLDARQKAVTDSLDQAKEAAKELESAEAKVTDLLQEARVEAEEVAKRAKAEATELLASAEKSAKTRAERIVAEARAQLDQDVAAARKALRKETIELVAAATESIIGEKLNAKTDSALIERALGNK